MPGFYDAVDPKYDPNPRDFTPQAAAQIPDTFSAAAERREAQCADIAFGKVHHREAAWFCTRAKGHSRRHAAGDQIIVLATWR